LPLNCRPARQLRPRQAALSLAMPDSEAIS
jgi:hypothetical protein